jgi:predicted metalloprotease with PDZ domain
MTLRKPLFHRQPSRKQRQTGTVGACLRLALFAVLCLLFGPCAAQAETLTARVHVISTAPARVRVEGAREKAASAWSFRNVYANVMNLGERIENLKLYEGGGAEVQVKRLAPGEYEAAAPASRFVYEVKPDAPLFEGDAAHVSWLTPERGFLMLGDLLPLVGSEQAVGARVTFTLPENWAIASSEKATASGGFELADFERAVFFVGPNLRERRGRVGAMEFVFVTAGEWAFSDEEARDVASRILKEHSETFGGAAAESVMLALSPFPRAAAADHWSAETRGTTVTLLAGKSPSRNAALAQLSFPLAHELFHLWVPNALRLDGSYDWFYEGFTLYQALAAAVRLELLTFQDYLNAVARAFDAYRTAQGREQLSLLKASEQRWTLSPALVYNKGMLVAFLYDLALRQQTRNKRSLTDVYRELFRTARAHQGPEDGNSAALAALNSAGELRDLTRRYVEDAGEIELQSAVAPFGLRAETFGARTRLSVAESLSGSQRDLLRKFGYNEQLDGTHAGRRAPARN